jgi:hypothetical protein
MRFRIERVETVLSECFFEAPDWETADDIVDKGNLKFEETNQTSDIYIHEQSKISVDPYTGKPTSFDRARFKYKDFKWEDK